MKVKQADGIASHSDDALRQIRIDEYNDVMKLVLK